MGCSHRAGAAFCCADVEYLLARAVVLSRLQKPPKLQKPQNPPKLPKLPKPPKPPKPPKLPKPQKLQKLPKPRSELQKYMGR